MAPQVLADQHAAKFRALARSLPPGLRPRSALLTGSTRTRERRATLAGLAAGEIDVVFGTHSLIGEGVEFKQLGVAVIDEQHRWAVMTRR